MDNVKIIPLENAAVKLKGVEQLCARMSATENSSDNEMFILLSDMIRSVREDIEVVVGIESETKG